VHRRRHGHRDGGGSDLIVRIAAAVIDRIVRHALAERPRECCGLLVGSPDSIVEAIAAENLAVDPGRYLIDPQTHIAAQRRARARGLVVAGFYHSHPHSGPGPSPTDLAEASYADHLYLIVGLAAAAPELRLFEYAQRNFVPVEFVTVP
jgi:proteasome lid subunit RPN8/RPN11